MKLSIVLWLCLLLMACATPVTRSVNQSAQLNVEIAMRYLQDQEYIRAKEHFLLALNVSPKDPAVLSAYGLYLAQVGDVRAVQYFQKAIQWHPHSALAHNNYGIYLCREKHFQQARVQFQQALLQSNYLYVGQTYENLGICAKLQGRQRLAKQYFAKALRLNPNLSFSKKQLGSS